MMTHHLSLVPSRAKKLLFAAWLLLIVFVPELDALTYGTSASLMWAHGFTRLALWATFCLMGYSYFVNPLLAAIRRRQEALDDIHRKMVAPDKPVVGTAEWIVRLYKGRLVDEGRKLSAVDEELLREVCRDQLRHDCSTVKLLHDLDGAV